MIKILYFAWLRQKIGKNSEEISLPDSIKTVGELMEHLGQSNEIYQILLEQQNVIKIAVNQHYQTQETLIKAGDEIAFFPPVTGG